jgi:hypothetical protein
MERGRNNEVLDASSDGCQRRLVDRMVLCSWSKRDGKLVIERQDMKFNEIDQKSCDDWHSGKSKTDENGFDPDRWICEHRKRNHAVTDPTLIRMLENKHPVYDITDYLQFAKSQLSFLAVSLLTIWGSLAMFQWLIRGVL